MLQGVRKLKYIDYMLVLMLFIQLGIKTNMTYDKDLSLILSFLVTVVFLSHSKFILKIPASIRISCIWYSLFVFVCASSYFWAINPNEDYIFSLVKDTFVSFILVAICVGIYLSFENTEFSTLITCLLLAEVLTTIRAIVYTPIIELITSFNSKLYGSGLGVNYNYFTTQLALVFIPAFFMAQYYKNIKYKIIVFFLGSNILISASRKAIIIAIIGAVALFVMKGNKKNILLKTRKILVISIVVVTFLFVIVKVPVLYKLVGKKLLMALDTIGKSAKEMTLAENIDHSAHGRSILRSVAFEQFLGHPFCGLGYYCFMYHNSYGLYAHNNYLEILADLGILGFITYYWYYLYCVFRFIEIKKLKNDVPEWILAYVMMFCLLIMEYSHITMFRLYALIPALVVFSACINYKR